MTIVQLRKAAVIAVAILTAISLVTGQAAEFIGKFFAFLGAS
jgi:hypothetical protein